MKDCRSFGIIERQKYVKSNIEKIFCHRAGSREDAKNSKTFSGACFSIKVFCTIRSAS